MNGEERAAAHGKHMSNVEKKISVEMHDRSGKRGFEGVDWIGEKKGGGRDVRQGRVDPLRGTALPSWMQTSEKRNLKSSGTE